MRVSPWFNLSRRALLAFSSLTTLSTPSTIAMTITPPTKVIDSHLHVWASSQQAAVDFPYAQAPPDALQDRASTEALLEQMRAHGVDGALIVQPINHKFDHGYVRQALQTHPTKFKGMMLHNPSLDAAAAVAELEELHRQGFVGVRFNPYLWPKLEGSDRHAPMSEGAGLAVYAKCAELKMPVGIMCFQGLDLHYDDILQLLEKSPQTTLILDHFGFTGLDKPDTFQQLLNLAKYNNVYVKVSAVFRLKDEPPFEKVKTERLMPLLQAFGPNRLMYGSDFPFVLEQPQAYAMSKLVSSWIEDEDARRAVMGGTAEKVFGKWA